MRRREVVGQLGLGAILASGLAGGEGRRPRILLRSSWASKNIGDIAHTPGVIRLLDEHLGDVEVRLWPSRVDLGVDEALMERFPSLVILRSKAEIEQAIGECDFFLHGSGAVLVAENDVRRWREETGKPYGVYGITLPRRKFKDNFDTPPEVMARTIELLNGASFVYFRETRSLKRAREKGCTCPVMGFAPDGAFACDLRDDAAAERFLRENGLEEGKFLCVIPRYRYTPVWRVPGDNRPFDATRHARNEEMKEHDHVRLRESVELVVRETDYKILICPEDRTQMAIGKEMLLDKLPATVRARVVWKPDYWLTGEATSTYVRSAGLFGNEMHSPILCIGHGIPAIVCRSVEQTEKGFMWEDIGLGDWLFDLDDEARMEELPRTVLRLVTYAAGAREKAARARELVERRQRETMAELASVVG